MRYDILDVVQHKFGNAEHLKAINGKIVEWNPALGEQPTELQIDEWGIEYDVYLKSLADAETAKVVAKKASLEKINTLEAEVAKTSDNAGLKAVVLELVKQLKILNGE